MHPGNHLPLHASVMHVRWEGVVKHEIVVDSPTAGLCEMSVGDVLNNHYVT